MSGLEQTIPDGYQQTEIGLIPDAWELLSFGELVKYIKGYPFKSSEYTDSGIRVVRVSDTSYSSIKNENPIFVSQKSECKYKKWALKKGDLIFTTVGSKPPMYDSLVGKAILVEDKHEGFLLNQNAVLIKPQFEAENVSNLLLNHFRTERYIDHIEKIYRGNANQASITLDGLFEFKIPLPKDPKEQTAIANALSDVDALLCELEKLIAKKQAIKTATMQQLLMGKTRLPQFATYADGDKQGQVKGTKPSELGEIPEDWEVKTLASMLNATPSYGINAAAVPLNGNLPVYIRITDISEDGYFKPSKRVGVNSPLSDLYKLQSGDLVLARTGASVGKSYLYRESDGELVFAGFLIRVSPNEKKLISAYLSHYLKTDKYWAWVTVNSMRSGQPGINGNEFGSLPLPVPSTEEQTAIATILFDMDEEIQALKQRLSKTSQIKQGMMQELLTGKTRLPFEKTEG